MPYIQHDDKQYPLPVGEARLGGPDADVVLAGVSSSAEAVVQCVGDDRVFIRRARDEADVRVNGVRLGAEPTPLFHGDRIELAGLELLFGDQRSGGNTQFLDSAAVRGRIGKPVTTGPRRRTASTGGRLVSLVDGREYAVPAAGAVIGREAGCDVVVAAADVSRPHAEHAPAEGGYLLRDLSANGVCVNDERIEGEQLLGRGDVVRVGSAEFRFYADAVEPAPSAAAPEERPASRAEVPSLADTAVRPAFVDSRPVLATLEVVGQGVLRGRRFPVRTPLAHIGRGVHNDVVVPDDSVSETHAKLQKREAGWYVVDMDSTNGTYVAGKRVRGEQRLEGAPDLRFGGVKMTFEGADASAQDATGTRAIAGRSAAPRRAPIAGGATASATITPPAAPEKVGGKRWLWVVGLAAAGATAVFLMRQGR
jgi:pSer/pThr/pTyr-binding forkhead associated (FHA) protein